LEHQYSLIECFHPPDDYNTEVADNLAMVDVGTADAAAGDGDAVVRCGHLQCGQLSLVIVLKAYRNWLMPQSQIMHLYI
jgi:hypothetical protein